MTKRRERLLEKLGERAGELAEYAGLEHGLATIIEGAVERLPHRPVGEDAFIERLAEALLNHDGPATLAQLERICAADLYFACALAAKDARAVDLAETELMTAVRQSAGRVDSTRAFVDEVSQRVRDRLLVGDGVTPPAITQYRGTGPLGRWVRVVASRIALDIKRADARTSGDSEDTLAQLPAPNDPELEIIWRTCAVEYKAALDKAFAGLSKRDRNLMRQRYLDDLNIDALGRIYRVNPSTAFRWLKQVEQKLAEATRTALMDKLAISESQVYSMERMVASQLQVSLARMLKGGKPT